MNLPPEDIELEYMAAGLISPQEVANAYERDLLTVLLTQPCPEAQQAIAIVDADDFHLKLHGELFRWLRKSYQKYGTSEPMDLLTAMSAAKQRDLFELTNDLWGLPPSYGAPHAWRVVHYATRVHELAVQRRLFLISCLETRALAGEGAKLPDGTVIDPGTSPTDVIAATSAARRKLAQRNERAGMAKHIADYRAQALAEETVSGLAFGIRKLDEILRGGLKPDTLTVLGARPAMGKSALMMNAVKAWQQQEVPGVVFSLEMPGYQLYQRFLADMSGLERDKWASHPDQVAHAADLIDEWGVEIADQAGSTIEQVRAECERRAAAGTLGWVMIDHLTIMGLPEGHDRHDLAVGAITSECKRIAKDFHVPVLLAAQLSRRVEERANKRPMLSDLRETGKIEEDADVVMFLYRDHYYNPTTADPRDAEIVVAKNRAGATDTAPARWNSVLTRFEDPMDSDDVLL